MHNQLTNRNGQEHTEEESRIVKKMSFGSIPLEKNGRNGKWMMNFDVFEESMWIFHKINIETTGQPDVRQKCLLFKHSIYFVLQSADMITLLYVALDIEIQEVFYFLAAVKWRLQLELVRMIADMWRHDNRYSTFIRF